MTHSDVTEDLANNKEKGEEIQQAQAGPAVTDQVPFSDLDLNYLYSSYFQCSGSGSGLDPVSMGSLDLYTDSQSGSGSMRAKMVKKNIKQF